MAEDRTIAISSSNHLGPDEIARHTFGTSRRGFDPNEVRAFLEEVARELSSAQDRERLLEKDIAEAEHRAENPVLDEATLTAALGQETARVLRSAHDAAAELVAKAEADAARLRTQVEDEATQLQARTEQSASDRIAQAEAMGGDQLERKGGAYFRRSVAAHLGLRRRQAQPCTAGARGSLDCLRRRTRGSSSRSPWQAGAALPIPASP